MNRLTFDEFRRLPREEQNRRYAELSEHDRFLARMNDWQPAGVTRQPMTAEEFQRLPPGFQEFFKDFKPV
jgi:hypothetical protein